MTYKPGDKVLIYIRRRMKDGSETSCTHEGIVDRVTPAYIETYHEPSRIKYPNEMLGPKGYYPQWIKHYGLDNLEPI